MFGKKKKVPSPPMETIIGPATEFKGELKSDGGIRIDGAYGGSLETTGNVIISEGAKVTAEVTAHNISISGEVQGNIMADRVEVLSTGRVIGDVTVNSFLLDEGGHIQGKLIMKGTELKPPSMELPEA
ncbi:MAG: polymer-forming cytoskeletal protein [Chloroflexota bacterium]|nr:polymer-forming cytoskeletal protein [Chloroflexota bacterium]